MGAKPAKAIDAAGFCLKRKIESPTRITAAIAARLMADRQLGGRDRRSARRSAAVAPLPPRFFFSEPVGLRPVRPRVSTVPAALPRCLLRRLRFVWAMAEL